MARGGAPSGGVLPEHPQVLEALIERPPEAVERADRFYRALALEEEDCFREPGDILAGALPGV